MQNFYCGWIQELGRWRIETFCARCGANYSKTLLTKDCDNALRRIRENSNLCDSCVTDACHHGL